MTIILAKRTWAALLLATALIGGACTSETNPSADDDTDEDGDPSEDDDQADDDQADDQTDDDQADDEAPAPPKDAGTKLDSGRNPAATRPLRPA